MYDEDSGYEAMRDEACEILHRRGIDPNAVEPRWMLIVNEDMYGNEAFFEELVSKGRRMPKVIMLDEGALDESISELGKLLAG